MLRVQTCSSVWFIGSGSSFSTIFPWLLEKAVCSRDAERLGLGWRLRLCSWRCWSGLSASQPKFYGEIQSKLQCAMLSLEPERALKFEPRHLGGGHDERVNRCIFSVETRVRGRCLQVAFNSI
jgi:hypothetical protein